VKAGEEKAAWKPKLDLYTNPRLYFSFNQLEPYEQEAPSPYENP
jgi:hypothetical protein